jgi:hypothetical protein
MGAGWWLGVQTGHIPDICDSQAEVLSPQKRVAGGASQLNQDNIGLDWDPACDLQNLMIHPFGCPQGVVRSPGQEV